MSEQESQNKRTIRRMYEEAGNEGRLEVLDEIAWPDHVEHYPLPGQTTGQQLHQLGTRLDHADRLGQLERDQRSILQLAERSEEDAIRE